MVDVKYEILTVKEVAVLLQIGEKTAYSLTQQGKLPGFKFGGQWRFRRADIEGWIDNQKKKKTKTFQRVAQHRA